MDRAVNDRNGERPAASEMPVLLEGRRLTKYYGALRVLHDIGLTVRQGEVLAVVGENGAGKSTLMKILSGVLPAGSYEGDLAVNGHAIRLSSVRDGDGAGIVLVPQELHVIPHLSIAENMFASDLPGRFGLYDEETAVRWAKEALAVFGMTVDPKARAAILTPSERRLIVLAAALHRSAKLLILDEPTAALTELESEALLEQLRSIRDSGVAIIYITHRLDEIDKIADRVLVLRNGASAGDFDHVPGREQMVRAMIGDAIHSLRAMAETEPFVASGSPVLEVKDLSVYADAARTRPRAKNISFDVHAGEIVGLYGLVGAGRTEMARALFGMWPGPVTGTCVIDGREGRPLTPQDAVSRGLSLLVEDRKSQGVLPGQSVLRNMTVSMLNSLASFKVLIDHAKESETVEKLIRQLGVRPAQAEISINALSGGNQQKVLLGRCLFKGLKVLVLDEPTLGVDIGARADIYRLIRQIAREMRVGVLMISSDSEEIITESDRILVMYKSRIQKTFVRGATTEELLSAATGAVDPS